MYTQQVIKESALTESSLSVYDAVSEQVAMTILRYSPEEIRRVFD